MREIQSVKKKKFKRHKGNSWIKEMPTSSNEFYLALDLNKLKLFMR